MKMVVYTLLTTAFILLFYTRMDQKSSFDHGLGRRFGFKTHTPIFDPLVAKMEKTKEEGKVEKNDNPKADYRDNSWANEFKDANDYFSAEGKLNITLRIIVLFPWLDNAPKDGFIDFKELEVWNTKMAMDRLSYLTEREMEAYDKDGDGAVSFREYLPQLTDEDIENNGMRHGQAGWWKEQFDNADRDHNGFLSLDEFKDFLHPEDSKIEKIQKWLLKGKIKRMDYDDDGKINFVEFKNGPYDIYKNYVDFETAGADVSTAEEKFSELDIDKDELLTVDELMPILHYLHPGELTYAKYFTSYLFHEADDNRDGKLTIDEMLNHDYVFYSTVYDESREETEDVLHDEL